MPLAPTPATRLAALATVLSAAIGLLGALAMGDRVRLVDIVVLFFSGAGSGAGVAALLLQRRARRAAEAAPPPPVHGGGLHTPPTVPWRDGE